MSITRRKVTTSTNDESGISVRAISKVALIAALVIMAVALEPTVSAQSIFQQRFVPPQPISPSGQSILDQFFFPASPLTPPNPIRAFGPSLVPPNPIRAFGPSLWPPQPVSPQETPAFNFTDPSFSYVQQQMEGKTAADLVNRKKPTTQGLQPGGCVQFGGPCNSDSDCCNSPTILCINNRCSTP